MLKEAEDVSKEMKNIKPDDSTLDYCKAIGDEDCNCRFMIDSTDPTREAIDESN